MKKLLLSVIVAAMFVPSLVAAQTAPAEATPATPAAVEKAPASPAVETAAKGKKAKKAPGAPKACNPAKSKPCGKGCIPLKSTCHKS